ncbi:hypothetical protein BT96DRAFT_912123, partial [Gymnopus androsaceus JB14]
DALTNLTRSELQALGKAHDVKANSKSTTIIAQLLKKFPDGVPSQKSDTKPLPAKKGGAKKGGAKKKKTQIKKEESVVHSPLQSTVPSGPSESQQARESPSQQASAADEPTIVKSTGNPLTVKLSSVLPCDRRSQWPSESEQTRESPSQQAPAADEPTIVKSTGKPLTSQAVVRSPLRSAVPSGPSESERTRESPSHQASAADKPTVVQSAGKRLTRHAARAEGEVSAGPSSLLKDIAPQIPVRLPEQRIEEPPPAISPQVVASTDKAADVPAVEDEDEYEYGDNLSVISEYSHAASESSAGSASDPVANDATIKYVVDIIRANTAEDQKIRETIQRLRLSASTTKTLLQQQYQILQGEREQRERVIKFLLYHIRNNNHWREDLLDPKQVSAEIYQHWVTNGGKGTKDMGEWEYDELYSGPIKLNPNNNLEISPSEEEEYLRGIQEAEEARNAEAASTSGVSQPPARPPAEDFPASSTEASSKRLRHNQPATEDDIAPGSSSSAIMAPRDKGKGKMNSMEVERLEREEARSDAQ